MARRHLHSPPLVPAQAFHVPSQEGFKVLLFAATVLLVTVALVLGADASSARAGGARRGTGETMPSPRAPSSRALFPAHQTQQCVTPVLRVDGSPQ